MKNARTQRMPKIKAVLLINNRSYNAYMKAAKAGDTKRINGFFKRGTVKFVFK